MADNGPYEESKHVALLMNAIKDCCVRRQ